MSTFTERSVPRTLARAGLLLTLLLAAALAGCGKSARPQLPEGETDQFPRQYPSPDEV